MPASADGQLSKSIEPVQAAAVVLVQPSDTGARVLLTKRALKNLSNQAMSFAGAWVVPGGVVEPVDADRGDVLRECGARELAEEVGVVVTPADLVELWALPAQNARGRQYETTYFGAFVWSGVAQVDQVELVDLIWIEPAKALELAASGEIEIPPATLETLRRLAESPELLRR